MKHHHRQKLDVDICAALLTSSPPRLPLREELPSLGFEVIYHAAGIGAKASKHEAYRAAKVFRRQEEYKELKKRRFFPKSSRRIKEKLAERRRRELELRQLTNAVSYEAYHHELLQYDRSGDTGSSSDESSRSSSRVSDTTLSSTKSMSRLGREAAETLRKELVKKRWGMSVRKNRKFGVGHQNGSPTESPAPPSTVSFFNKKDGTLDGSLGYASFPDFLAPIGMTSETAASTTPKSSTVLSHDPSTITTPQQGFGQPHFVEFHFGSPNSVPYLPALNTVAESVGSKDLAETSGELVVSSKKDEQIVFPDLLQEGGKEALGSEPSGPSTTVSMDPSSISTPSSMKKTKGHSPMRVFGVDLSLPLLGDTKKPEEEKTIEKDQKPTLADSVKKVFANLKSQQLFETSALMALSGAQKDPSVKEQIVPSPEKEDSEGHTTTKEPHEHRAAEESQSFLDPTAVEAFANASLAGSDSAFWMASAKLTIESIATDMLKMVGGIAADIELETVEEFFEVLSRPSPDFHHQIEATLAAKPEYARVTIDEDSRLALHILCDRDFPDRKGRGMSVLAEELVDDIETFKNTLILVHEMNPAASETQDDSSDLPVHLLARTLMEWEAQWYDDIYKQTGNQEGPFVSESITTLYQLMSECVGMLLKPICQRESLCCQLGSIGTLYPLHIAAIFAAPVPTLRRILESYPEAASVVCDLGGLRTFVPDKSLPIELHSALSTDFPKWETERQNPSTGEIKWSQSSLVEHARDDTIRRSDLLFAYNPVSPFSSDKERIRRLEARIRNEAVHAVEAGVMRPDHASELIWVWMCTYRDRDSKKGSFAKSVKRITDPLSLRSIQMLASVPTKTGQLTIDAANPECSAVLRQRMERVTETIIPISSGSTSEGAEKSKVISPTLQSWEAMQSARLFTTEKGLVSHACNQIFNSQGIDHPTSFVILPYKLKYSRGGKVGIESADAAAAAIKFADFLLHLTDPRSILYFLDKKSRKHYGVSFYDHQDDFRSLQYNKIREHEEALMKLYGNGPAYLYLIDEATGIPILQGRNENYPIILDDSINLLRKVLPLMLKGMLQMRGEKALSVLISVLLDDSLTTVPGPWVKAAQDIGGFLYSQRSKEAETSVQADETTGELLQFTVTAPEKIRSAELDKNSTSEWELEASILKMLFDMNDPEHTFGGLERLTQENGVQLWTSPPAADFDPIVESRDEPVDVAADAMEQEDYHHPIDIDIIDEILQQDTRIHRKLSGPVDLDDSIAASSKSSGPCLSELERKHDELSQLYGSVQSIGNSTPPLGFPQPPESEEDSRPHREAPPRIIRSDFSDGTSTSLDTDSVISPVSHASTNNDPTVPKQAAPKKWSPLFGALAVTEQVVDDHRDAVETRLADEGERVWHDLQTHLNHNNIFCEDVTVLQLKVGVAKEAERLSRLSRQVRLLHETAVRFTTKESPTLEWRVDGLNSAAATRRLLLRLLELEDRILVGQIDLQHSALETYVISENLKVLMEQQQSYPELPQEKEETPEDMPRLVENVAEGPPEDPLELLQSELAMVAQKSLSAVAEGESGEESSGEFDIDRPLKSIEFETFESFEFQIPPEADDGEDDEAQKEASSEEPNRIEI